VVLSQMADGAATGSEIINFLENWSKVEMAYAKQLDSLSGTKVGLKENG